MTEFITFIYNFTWTNGEGTGEGLAPLQKNMEAATDWIPLK